MRKNLFSLVFMPFLMCFGACKKESKKQMYEQQLELLKHTQVYQDVQKSAKASFEEWLKQDLEEVRMLNDCNWKIDEAVFFNTAKNKAYLLLVMQDRAPDAELDYVNMAYAALENGKWGIYFLSLPNMVFPRDRFSKDKFKPIPLSVLSEYSRESILNSYIDRNGKINDAYVESEYTDELKARKAKFLNPKK